MVLAGNKICIFGDLQNSSCTHCWEVQMLSTSQSQAAFIQMPAHRVESLFLSTVN